MRGSLLAVAGTGIAAFGLFLAVAGGIGIAWTGPDGTVTGDEVRLTTDAAALLVTPEVLRDPVTGLGGDTPTLRVRAEGGPRLFLGVAPRTAVASYLRGARVAEVRDLDPVTVVERGAEGVPRPPATRRWTVTASGAPVRDLVWRASPDDVLVVMNADGAGPVRARLRPAVDVPVLVTVAVAITIVGALLTLLGAALLVAGVLGWRTALRRERAAGGAPPVDGDPRDPPAP